MKNGKLRSVGAFAFIRSSQSAKIPIFINEPRVHYFRFSRIRFDRKRENYSLFESQVGSQLKVLLRSFEMPSSTGIVLLRVEIRARIP